jgi:fibronectin type 3 domain-containing protein
MRSPIPIILATCGLIAAGILAWRPVSRESGDPPEHPAGGSADLADSGAAETTTTHAGEPSEPLSRLFSAPLISLERGAVVALFDLGKGAVVSLPLPGSPRAEAVMKHRHDGGAIAIGFRLEGKAGATLFLSRSSGGVIEGHLSSLRSGSAFRLEDGTGDDPPRLRRITADELICARFDGGQLQPGLPPDPESAEVAEGSPGAPEESAPLLESRPSASRVIFLNFDGETVTGTPWNLSYNDGNPIVAAPFATPAHIPGIWASIAEDYATFDVNVTTDRADFDNAAPEDRVMILFSPTKSWYGSAGGVAYVNSFGSATNPYAWVFNLTLNGTAESGAHEIGHTLGLRHDGTSSRAYYTGHTHASGVSWAPIMGTGYGKTIVQFSKGEYPGANRTENDLQIMATHLDPLPDDHGDSAATATEPAPSAPGEIEATGVVGNATDRDLYRVVTGGAGTLTATATPHATYRNLDLGLELLDANLVVIQDSAPAGPFHATVTAPALPAGTYFLRVRGTGLGDLVTGYGSYGSIGTYRLAANFPTSPLPDTPTNLSAGDGTSTSFVPLSWDRSPLADNYRVYRGLLSNGSDAALVASPTGTSFDDPSAVPGTIYFYFITAANASGESPRSSGESGWRQRLPPDPAASVTASDDSPHSIRVAWPAADRAQSYRVSRNAVNAFAGSTVVGTTSALSWHDTTTAVNATFHYFIESINTGGTSAPVATTLPGRKTPLPPGTPTGLYASDGVSPTLTQLTWTAADGATGYRVYRNTVESVAGATEIAVLGETTAHADIGGTRGVVYWYFVRAILPGGDSAPCNLDEGRRLAAPPGAPVSVTATRGTNPGGVFVEWSATTDSESYLVFRGNETDPGSAELIGETSSTEWLDDTAAPGRTYHYFVRSVNTAGSSTHSAAVLGYGTEVDPSDDGYENNDDVSEATAVASGEIAAVGIDGDPDWYAVTLGPGISRLDLAAPYEASLGSVLLALCDESGAPVASATAVNSSRVLSHTGAPGASYRILVECDEGPMVPYRLIVSPLAPGRNGLSPDGAIGATFPPRLGKAIRNGNGAGQTLRLVKRGSGSLRYFASLTNRSAVSGGFLTQGPRRKHSLRISHSLMLGDRRIPVTGAVAGRGLPRTLAPFDVSSFSISVRMAGGRASQRNRHSIIPLVHRVAVDSKTLDQVRCHLIRRPVPRR